MQNYLFILGCIMVGTTGTARASVCVFPDDGNNFTAQPSDCPRIDWSLDGDRMSLPDHGELLWADAAGKVHYERSLADVPEPYHSMYRQGRRNAQGGLEFDVAQAPVPDSVDRASTTEQLIEARAAWRSTTATWQAELYASLRDLLQAMMRPAPLAFNPLLFAYPPGRSLVDGTQQQAALDARARALHARHMLLEVLPRTARTQAVPPAWLRAQAVR